MRRRARSRSAVAGIATALLLGFPAAAGAHVTRVVGPLQLTIGWADEPAYTGSRNFVEVAVADIARRAPVSDIGGSLTAEVVFGDARLALPLLPGATPGKFSAALVPTRPGTYTFHVSGTVKGTPIDLTVACSERTFACVTDSSEIQFPARDPSTGEVAERLTRGLPRAEERATSARRVALLALALAAAGLGVAIGLGVHLRRSRKNV